MKKLPGNLLKNLEKSWKYHGILSVRRSGNPDNLSGRHRSDSDQRSDCITIFLSLISSFHGQNFKNLKRAFCEELFFHPGQYLDTNYSRRNLKH